jgi:drug/metabolite transporter (DMT)-like permease
MCRCRVRDCVVSRRSRYNVRMNRPKGLLVTAWIMVALVVAGWLRGNYWPPRTQPAHLHTFTIVLVLVVRITAFVCIFYYAQGRNWARIVVLATSVLMILSLIQLRHENALGQVTGAFAALLGVFFLFWLNTRSVREFFKRGAATIERS